MSYYNPTKTGTDVGNYVKRVFGDESGVQLTDTDIVRWINDAQNEIAENNMVVPAKATVSVTSGTATYSLSSVTPKIDRIASLLLDGRRVGNIPISQAEESISLADPGAVEVGAPQFWYEWAGEVTFWPKPNQDYTMTVRYFAVPTDISALGDTLTVPDDCFTDVCNYVLMKAYEMDENPEMMGAKQAEFTTSLAERGEKERMAQNMTYEKATVFELI